MKLNLNDFEAIIFDLGGVILNLDYNLTINAFKELGGNRFDELYTQAYQTEIIDQFEIGKATSDEFVHFMMSFLPDISDPERIVKAWNVMLLDLPDYRIDFLRRIGKHKRIFLFSNTNAIHFKEVHKILGSIGCNNFFEEVFEKAYFSHLVGKRKPNANAFQLVINENNIDPSRTLFIDDSIQHIEGAQKVGLQTYHLTKEDVVDLFTFD
ncbi:MAG: HAD family phosphatase [Crocinitomicaceae bacterium]